MELHSQPLAMGLVRWRAAAVSALVLLALALPALAAPLSAADARQVREVVRAQLAALAADDAEKAFSYAAPNVRKSLVSAANFMAMVRNQYAVVYRPAAVVFLKPEGGADEVVQRVQIVDANAVPWLAIYTLQRQKNKHWRISGCIVAGTSGRMA